MNLVLVEKSFLVFASNQSLQLYFLTLSTISADDPKGFYIYPNYIHADISCVGTVDVLVKTLEILMLR